MACLMNYTVQCVDANTGETGCFLFDVARWQDTGRFYAVSPVFGSVAAFYAWDDANGRKREPGYWERTEAAPPATRQGLKGSTMRTTPIRYPAAGAYRGAAELFAAIRAAAQDAPESVDALTLAESRELDPDEAAAPDFLKIWGWHAGDLQARAKPHVWVHGPARPAGHGLACFHYEPAPGIRASLKVARLAPRLADLAETVRKRWELFGGGPKPAELKRAPAPRRVEEWKPAQLRAWADMIAEGFHADAMACGDTLGAVYYPGSGDGGPIVLAGPQPVEGMPDGIVSGFRGTDRRWVVWHLASGLSLGPSGASRKAAEASVKCG